MKGRLTGWQYPQIVLQGESAKPWDSPAGRAHVLAAIKQYDIRAEHAYWGIGTPLEVRKQLIAEAWLGQPEDDEP